MDIYDKAPRARNGISDIKTLLNLFEASSDGRGNGWKGSLIGKLSSILIENSSEKTLLAMNEAELKEKLERKICGSRKKIMRD